MADVRGLRVVAGIGEVLMDRFETADGNGLHGEELFGGAPANFAYHASRCLDCTGRVVSAVGADERGVRITAAVTDRNLEFAGDKSSAYPSGVVNVKIVAGKNQYEIVEGAAWDHIRFDDALKQAARETDAVCFGTLAQRDPESAAAVRAFVQAVPEGAIKIFDANFRKPYYDKAVFERSAAICSIMKISDEEVEILSTPAFYGYDAKCGFDGVCRDLMARFGNLEAIVVTCGAGGSRLYRRGKPCIVRPAASLRKGATGTTVGAGDSFTGALCAALLSGLDDGRALEFASEVAAFVCSRREATPEYDVEICAKIREFGISGR